MTTDHTYSISNYYFQLSFEPSTVKRAFRTAIIVGIVLNFINHYHSFISLSFKDINPLMVILTFLVPYLVSTFSSVASNSSLRPGKISSIDGMLQCNNCKMVNFKATIGEEIEECNNCHKKTKWRPITIFSIDKKETDMLKSLALFARHNPQPLLRVDNQGVVTGANPSAEVLFAKESLVGDNIKILIPELSDLDISGMIRNNEKVNSTIIIKDHIFDLTIKGISSISTLNIYANEITQIVMAESKIKEQARNISDSIVYASRIQMALLPEEKVLKTIFPECFVFYKPKNVVSGDFYWVNELGDLKIIAVADCTGHGVPGAFMSMLGISLLNEIILREHITDPGEILNILRERLILSLSSGNSKSDVKDGMDISLAVINTKTKTLHFSGAYNSMYICRDGKLIVLEADRMPVGKHFVEYSPFSVKVEKVLSEDRFFMFSDGFKDQFGGVNNKKFSSGKFKDFIIETDKLPFDKIYDSLLQRFESWKLDKEQVDDVLVMGIKIDK